MIGGMKTLTVTTSSAEKTRKLGEQIAARCQGGEVFLLNGDLGAGKTCLTQGMARGLAIAENVTSPTFVTHMQYIGSRGLSLEHFDFYRLDGVDVDNLDFYDFFNDPRRVCVIEWPQVIPEILPREYVSVAITTLAKNKREIVLTAETPQGAVFLDGLAATV